MGNFINSDLISGMYATHFAEQDDLLKRVARRNLMSKVGLGLGGSLILGGLAHPTGREIAGVGINLAPAVIDAMYGSETTKTSSPARPEIKENVNSARLRRLASSFY